MAIKNQQCPKCIKGTMFYEEDIFEKREYCICCGYTVRLGLSRFVTNEGKLSETLPEQTLHVKAGRPRHLW